MVEIKYAYDKFRRTIVKSNVSEEKEDKIVAIQFPWRHNKRGTYYNTFSKQAMAQCSSGPINEGDRVVVYYNSEDQVFVRRYDEFMDGRFENIDGGP